MKFLRTNATVTAAQAAVRVRGDRRVRHRPRQGRPGRDQLYIDGKLAGQGDIPLTNPLNLGLLSTVNCGADSGSPVTPKYRPPYASTAKIYSVTVDVSGEMIKDTEAEMRVVMARQ